MKFAEPIRQLSRPALKVLIASVRLTGDGDIVIDRVASDLEWHPALVEACVRELHSLGAYSHILACQKQRDGRLSPGTPRLDERPGVAPLTREFAGFIRERGSDVAR